MFTINKILTFLIFLLTPFSSNAHVEHYKDLKRIEFDIYRNSKNIGKHIFSLFALLPAAGGKFLNVLTLLCDFPLDFEHI